MTFDMAAGLKGKRVLLTGAGGGIGRAVASAFADVGAVIAITDRDAGALDVLTAELAGAGHRAIPADLRDVSGHAALVDRAVEALGGIDVLVQTAGVLVRRDSIDDVTEADWDLQHDINLKATFFLARAAGRAMADAGSGGRIINFASQGWQTGGHGGSVAYAASKGGVVSLTRGLARSLAEHKITVNAVSPGMVDTAMLHEGLDAARLDQLIAQIPIKALSQPSHMAGAVLFLASDHAEHVTGATINVSGGWLMY